MARPALRDLAQRIGRHATLYAAGLTANAALSLASVAVLTRFLRPAAYGHLAILIFFGELLAIACDLGILQGTMRSVLSPGPESGDESRRRRQTMTTGLAA